MKRWVEILPEELDALADKQADGFSILDTLAESMQVRLHVNGHFHDQWQQMAPAGTQLCVSVGLRGITAIDADNNVTIVLPGELDAQREFRKEQERLFQGGS